MSPEQARGGHVDFRSDQFSFGLVLYEMATGRRAFSRDTPVQTLRAIIEDEPRSLGDVNPKTPIFLRWIVDRCLAKDPTQRYAATADLARDLRTLRDRLKESNSQPTVPTPCPTSVAPWRLPSVARWRLPSGCDALAARAGDPAVHTACQRLGLSGNAGLVAGRQDHGVRRRRGWRASDLHARISSRSGHRSPTRRSTAAIRSGPTTAAASTTCRRRREGGIYSVSAAGGPSEPEIPDADSGALSPDGRTLAFFRSDESNSSEPAVAGVAPSRRTQALHAGTACDGEVAGRFSSILTRWVEAGGLGAILALWRTGPTLWIIPTSGAAPRAVGIPKVLTTNNPPLFDWLSDNRRIVAAVEHDGVQGVHLWIVDSESGQMSRLTTGAGHESAPAVSPEGSRIAYAGQDTNFDLLEVPLDGTPIRRLLATSRNEMDPAWSPTRPEYAFVTDRNGPTEIWLRSRDGVWERPLVTAASFPRTKSPTPSACQPSRRMDKRLRSNK